MKAPTKKAKAKSPAADALAKLARFQKLAGELSEMLKGILAAPGAPRAPAAPKPKPKAKPKAKATKKAPTR